MVRWHHWLNGHGFELTPGDSEGQGSLGCCSPWDCKESQVWLSNWTTTLWRNSKSYKKNSKRQYNYLRNKLNKWRKVKVKSLSRVWLFVIPWTVAYQASPSMGFSRQEYWSELSFPSPGDLPDPGIKPGSTCIVGRRFNLWATREAL